MKNKGVSQFDSGVESNNDLYESLHTVQERFSVCNYQRCVFIYVCSEGEAFPSEGNGPFSRRPASQFPLRIARLPLVDTTLSTAMEHKIE